MTVRRGVVALALVVLVVVGSGVRSRADTPLTAALRNDVLVDRFSLANQNYREGHYEEARDLYEALARQSPDSAVLYNLGNAWFKLYQSSGGRGEGMLGRAIVAYEKALRLEPRHRDAAANLAYARSLVRDAVEVPAEGLPGRLWAAPTVDEVEGAGAVLVWLVALTLILRRRVRREATSELLFWVLFVLVPLTLATLTWAGTRAWHDASRSDAVVLAASVEIRSAPQEEATTVFTLHEGTTVAVVRDSQGWLQVSLPNGFAGWARQEALGRID